MVSAITSSCMGGGIIDSIKSIINVVRNIGNVLSNIFASLLTYVFMAIYYIFLAICQLILLVEVIFKKLAGTAPVTVDNKFTDNIVMGFLFSDAVMRVFLAMLVLAVFLLFVFTFIAIIKSEFALDAKGSAKGPIIGRAFKSLAMFVAIPLISVFGIFLTQGLTVGLDSLFAGKDTSQDNVGGMYGRVFYAAAYNCNRARISNKFNSQINSGWNNDGGNFTSVGNISSAYKIDQAFLSERAMVKTELPTSGSFVNYFGDSVNYSDISTKTESTLMCHVKVGERITKGLDSHIVLTGYPDETSATVHYTPLNAAVVNYYYDLIRFDYFIGIGGALVLAYFLLVTCFALMKRVFDIVILMLIAPPMIALGPLDNGDATKKWSKEMISRVISVLASVFAMNMFFVIVPVFASISFFGADTLGSTALIGANIASGVALAPQTGIVITALAGVLAIPVLDAIVQLMIVIVGASVVKDTSALVANLLGVKDLIKEGSDSAKKAAETAVKIGTAVATGGASLATLKAAHDRKKPLDEGMDAAGAVAAAKAKEEGASYRNIRRKRKEARENYKAEHEDEYKDATKQRNSGLAMMPGQLGKFGELFGKKAKLIKDANPDKEYKDILKQEEFKTRAGAAMQKKQSDAEEKKLRQDAANSVEDGKLDAINTALTNAGVDPDALGSAVSNKGLRDRLKDRKDTLKQARQARNTALGDVAGKQAMSTLTAIPTVVGAGVVTKEAQDQETRIAKSKLDAANKEVVAVKSDQDIKLELAVMMKDKKGGAAIDPDKALALADKLSKNGAGNDNIKDAIKEAFGQDVKKQTADLANGIADADGLLQDIVKAVNEGKTLTEAQRKQAEASMKVLAGIKDYETLLKDVQKLI